MALTPWGGSTDTPSTHILNTCKLIKMQRNKEDKFNTSSTTLCSDLMTFLMTMTRLTLPDSCRWFISVSLKWPKRGAHDSLITQMKKELFARHLAKNISHWFRQCTRKTCTLECLKLCRLIFRQLTSLVTTTRTISLWCKMYQLNVFSSSQATVCTFQLSGGCRPAQSQKYRER